MPKTGEPWLKLFTGDILADEELKSCSLAARGLFLYLLSLMHRSVRTGHLLQPSGAPWTPEQLSRMAGCSPAEVNQLNDELLTAGVFASYVDQQGKTVLYSRRMVREARLSEVRKEVGRKGGFAKAKSCQTDYQNAGKPGSKQPGNPLGSGELGFTSSKDKEEENSNSQPPPDFAIAKSWQNGQQNGELSVESLARLWTDRRGANATANEFAKAVESFAALVKSNGVALEAIHAEIMDDKRHAPSDPIFAACRRILDGAGKAKESDQLERLKAKGLI